jgi:hypothetical protein
MTRRSRFAVPILMLAGACQAADTVRSEDSQTLTFAVRKDAPTLELGNIWGDVRVRPGPGGEIIVRYTERRSAPDQQRFDRSREALRLRTRADEDGVYMYVGGPDPDNWHDSERCHGCRAEYQFDVSVPRDTRLDVSTVNDGRVSVEGIAGLVTAGNVNGPIAISGLAACDAISNVNGRVDVGFAQTPGRDCEIRTVNGDVQLGVPDGAGLDLAMDLFNGGLKSELPLGTLALPARVERSESDGRTRYRIEQAAGLRVASGGPRFTISSINGDIRIHKTP